MRGRDGYERIDAALAIALRRKPFSYSWRDIGGALALIDGRALSYKAGAVRDAATRKLKTKTPTPCSAGASHMGMCRATS